MELDAQTIQSIVNGVLLIVSAVFGKKMQTAKKKTKEVTNFGSALAKAGQELSVALEDNKLSKKEAKDVQKRFHQILTQWNSLWK